MRWRRFWQRQRRDADLARELESYLAEETAEQIAAGKSPDAARSAAMRKLGNVTRIREDAYERDSVRLLDACQQDLSYAWRLFRRNPGFTVVALLSVALGIGANTAVFTLFDQVLLRTLPVPNAGRLVLLTSAGYQYGNAWGDGNELSYPMYEDLRDGNDVFTDVFCRFGIRLDVRTGDSSQRVRAELVSGTYFSGLGVGAALGRVLDPSDNASPRGHPVVVLSHRLWRDRFGSDREVIGRSVSVNRLTMTVVGVAAPGFYGTDLTSATDLFVPVMMIEDVAPISTRDRRMRWLNVFGHLRPGLSADDAHRRLQPFYQSRLAVEAQEDAFARASASDKTRFLNGSLEVTPAAYGKSAIRSQLQRPLWILTGIGLVVLIVACANVANLLLARASTRRREIAIRLALGVSRLRLVRQLVVESMLLALVGGLAGLLLAAWGARVFLGFLAEVDPALELHAWPDARILAVNVLGSVVVGLLFGLVPAWQSTRPDAGPALKTESAASAGGGHARLRRGLVVAQVMLSLLLLVAAGLFVRSLQNLLTTDAGFDAERLLSFYVEPRRQGYEPLRTRSFAQALLEHVRSTPGVTGAGFVSHGLLGGGSWNNRMTIEGRPYDPNARIVSQNNMVSPGYFAAMGMRLVAGRDFGPRDDRQPAAGAPPGQSTVAIANEQFVKEFLDGRNPLGIHVGFGRDPGTATPTEIVGVVSTAKYTSMRSPPTAQLYFPYFEAASIDGLIMYVRTSQAPEALLQTMRRVVHDIDPMMPIDQLRTMDDQIRRSLVLDRIIASLSASLSALATLLAMVGLYGVMSYTVARRTRELAIRRACGAVSSHIAALVVKDMLLLVVAGVLLALPVIWLGTRFLSNLLYGLTPTDPTAIVSAASVLLVAACVAVWVPSRRALRVDPIAALRDE